MIEGLKPGICFKYKEIEWVCLKYSNDLCLAVTIEPIAKKKFSGNKYSDSTNNWTESKLRTYLNTEFLEMIGKEDKVQIKQNLIADNGDDNYGTCSDYVSLLTSDQFRKYRKYLPETRGYYWLITPTSCSFPNSFLVQASLMNRRIVSLTSLNNIGVHPLINVIIK